LCNNHRHTQLELEMAAGKLGQQLMTRLHLARTRPSATADVPRGHLAVYVGEGRKRLVIPTACLSHPAFVTLLKRVEDEFGFDHRCGGLTIPCASETEFAHIVGAAAAGDGHHHH
jgi:SAUR family protein